MKTYHSSATKNNYNVTFLCASLNVFKLLESVSIHK